MADTPSQRALPEVTPVRYPALSRLARRLRGRRRIPYVQQMQQADCGAACLAMVLGYHGRNVRLADIREAAGTDRDGSDALAILRAGEIYGLVGRGIRCEPEDLVYLQTATILHWEFNHFVVFDRVHKGHVEIVDPAFGRRRIPLDRFGKSFTGVGLVLEPSDAFEVTAKDKSQIWSYLRQLLSQRRVIARVVVASVLLRLFALSLPLLTGLVVDRVVPRGDLDLLWVIGAGLAMMVLFQLLAALIRAHLVLQLRTHLDTKMTLGFLGYLVDLPYVFFQQRSAGDLMMRVNSNATIREFLTSSTLSALLDGALVLIYLALILVLSATLGLIVLGLGLLQVLVFWLSRRRYRELMAQGLEAQARAQSYLVQLIGGIETLKTTGAEHRAVEHWSSLFVDELNMSLERGRLAALVDSLMEALRVASPLIILTVGAVQVLDGALSLGTMLALNALAVSFLMPLSSLVSSAIQLQLLASYIERIDDVLRTPPEQDRERVSPAPRLVGKIRLENVSFRYGRFAPLVVRDVSLEIRPGARVALVGRSGSGKSTLAKLLLGLYQPTDGEIFYDDHNLAELDVRSVRRQLGIVLQHPYIFGSSIRRNIALGDPRLPLHRIVEAARQACLHDAIAAMPMGYETIIGSDGSAMSGGELQRLALARALVSRPAILLLDEATSALDATTEKAVMENLASLACTRIVIAHRLSTIKTADTIIVLDGGRVVEQGTHDELIARGGLYHDLVSAQRTLDAAGDGRRRDEVAAR